MIFIDSNIPMYIVGSDHPNKKRALELVARLIDHGEFLITDSEVLQEVLHRYHAINRQDALDVAVQVLLMLVDKVFPVQLEDVLQARELLRTTQGPSARDAIHVAVMKRYKVHRILTLDRGFDQFPGLERLS